jgi:hypothetical protein
MAETKTQRTVAPTAVAQKPATAVERTTQLSGEALRSVEDAQRAAIDAVRKFVETAESLPPAAAHELVDLLRHLADMEYSALRNIVRSVVDVDVLSGGVNVDVLSKGVHVDVLSGGVNVDVLSREAR